MDIVQAIVLGIVQGLTEFLPISSSGHLVLTPWFLGWEDPGLSFDVALHFGTLIAVILYFWKDWMEILSSAFAKKDVARKSEYSSRMIWFLILATIPGVLVGYFLSDYAQSVFRDPRIIAFTLFIFGFLLFLADKRASSKKSTKDMSVVDSIVIGLAQAFAIIPGVSRSGITITAGLMQGLSRKSAAKFSFLLSTPIIFGATIYQASSFFAKQIGVAEVMGIISAAISGYLAIFWLIKFVEKASYKIFFWYRCFLAAVIIISFYLI